jgi:DNA-3-methyladenine glycosylase II
VYTGSKYTVKLPIYRQCVQKRLHFTTMAARRSARLSTTTPSSDSTRTDDAVTKESKSKTLKKEKILPIKSASGPNDETMPPPASARGGKRRASRSAPVDDSIGTKGGKKKRSKATEEPNVEPTTSDVNATADAMAPPKTPRKARRADPKATNAPLQTPGGTRVLKRYDTELFENSQDAAGVVTTDNLLETACRHLCSVDPRLQSAIDEHHCHILSPKGLEETVDPFVALCSSIISQQARCSTILSIESNAVRFPGRLRPLSKTSSLVSFQRQQYQIQITFRRRWKWLHPRFPS